MTVESMDDDRSTVTRPGGVPLAVFERGRGLGPTVVLVHGYPDNHVVWQMVVERLAIAHHLVTYDVRGAGESGMPATAEGYRMKELVADLVAVIDAVSPGEPVHLVAHDWGSIQSWAAVTDADPSVRSRFASFTSISGPGLDHASAWMKRHRRPGDSHWRTLARQLVSSWYIAALAIPLGPFAWRHGLANRFPMLLARTEGRPVVRRGEHDPVDESTGGVIIDARWPGPHLGDDAARGAGLYRANMVGRGRRARRPGVPTEVPVLLIVARDDAFVTPALLDGIEDFAPDLDRRPVDGGHWLPRSRPTYLATQIAGHVAAHDQRPHA